jgi:hippurate hydrolase
MTDRTALDSLLPAAQAVLPDVVRIRRTLHQRPEIGLALPETQGTVADELRAIGLEPQLGKSVGSVTAVLEGGATTDSTRTILLRADMDALPLTEQTGLPFASELPGAMHACGHDTHVAMLLGAARLLAQRRDELPGNVLFMFQPGEEGYHGARFMLEEGLLDLPRGVSPTGAFAIHIGMRYPTGTFNVRSGPMMAAGDTIRITVRGRGGHASAPHLAVDPISVAAAIVQALQTMVTRRVDAFDPAVVTIANIAAGTTTNIIPESAFMQGTMRTVSDRTREQVRAHVRTTAESIAAAYGATAEVDLEAGYPVTVNEPGFTQLASEVATEVLGGDKVTILDAPIMGAEDFSYVLQRVPGAIGFLGARPADVDEATCPQNHSDRVVFDESAMAAGVAIYTGVALRHLGAG